MDESNFFMAYKGKRSSHAHAGALQSWNDGNVHSNFNLYKRRQAQFGANPEARNAPTSETIWNLPCHILSLPPQFQVCKGTGAGTCAHQPDQNTIVRIWPRWMPWPSHWWFHMNISHAWILVTRCIHWIPLIHLDPPWPRLADISVHPTDANIFPKRTLQDTTSAMAIQPPQWSRLYIQHHLANASTESMISQDLHNSIARYGSI